MPDDLTKLLGQLPDLEADPRAVDALILKLRAAMPPVSAESAEDPDWRLFLGMCGGVAFGGALGVAASALGMLAQIPKWVFIVGSGVALAVLVLLAGIVTDRRAA